VADSVITEALRALIGVETDERVAEITTTGCRLFARAVGHTDFIYYDESAARARGYRSVVAPPGYLGTPVYTPGAPDTPAVPGPPGSPYPRVLNGGTTFEYFDTLVAGDVVTSRRRITGFQERDGSIGPMLLTTSETIFTRQDGAVVAKMYATAINY